MITREDLIKTKEYWFETTQNEIYRLVSNYIKNVGITQTQFAEHLGVSKGYVSQILNGNFNATLKKLIELSLSVNAAPIISFQDLEEFVKDDFIKRYEMQYNPHFILPALPNLVPLVSGLASNAIEVKPTEKPIISEAA